MKQGNLFNDGLKADDLKQNTTKIKGPVYTPRGVKPNVIELYDTYKTNRLITEIQNSGVTEGEKKFLISAAQRHTVFQYGAIADYYANASDEMQNLMEHSALVIIDFEKAIQYGYVKLNEDIKQEFLKGDTDEK